jgi:hypothetical protein
MDSINHMAFLENIKSLIGMYFACGLVMNDILASRVGKLRQTKL